MSACRPSCRACSATPRSMCRTDRIKKPEDLKGKKVGVPEYQLTANVWARAILEDDFGVKPSDIHWMRGGIEHAGRPEKITIKLPHGVRLDNAPEGKTISRAAGQGRDRRLHGAARARDRVAAPNIGWLFRDPVAAGKDYYKRTGIFPIMHLIGVRRTLAEQHPWLPAAVLKAFEQSKAAAMAQLSDTSATKVTLPFVEEQRCRSARADGRGLLALWRRAEPQDARDVPAPSSRAGLVVAAGEGRGAVPPRQRWRASRFTGRTKLASEPSDRANRRRTARLATDGREDSGGGRPPAPSSARSEKRLSGQSSMAHRVVVTGWGVVSSIGQAAKSVIGPIWCAACPALSEATLIPPDQLTRRWSPRSKDFEPTEAFRRPQISMTRPRVAVRGGGGARSHTHAGITFDGPLSGANRDHHRNRRRRTEHPGRKLPPHLPRQCQRLLSAYHPQADGERAGEPDLHALRAARSRFRGRQRLRLGDACHRPGVSHVAFRRSRPAR